MTRAADVVFPVAPVDRQGRHVRHLGGPPARRSRRSSATPTLAARPAGPGRHRRGAAARPARLPHRRRGARADGGDRPVGRRARRRCPTRPAAGSRRRRRRRSPSPPGSRCSTTARCRTATTTCAPPPGRRSCRVSADRRTTRSGPTVTVTGDRGSVTLPAEVADDLADGVVWVPGQLHRPRRPRRPRLARQRRHREGSRPVIAMLDPPSPTSADAGARAVRPRPVVARSLLKAVLIFVILVLLTLFNIWLERRVVARMQHRIGPNVNGPFGLLQSPRRRREAGAQGGHHPQGRRQGGLPPGAGDRGGPGVRDLLGDPVRPGGRRPVHRHRRPRCSSPTCRSRCCS